MSDTVIEAKVVVLGRTGVGKTSVVVRYISGDYDKRINPTIGASFFACQIAVESYRVNLQVWDTAGQERFRSMTPLYYRNANAALLVYDITSRQSFVEMQSWVVELKKNALNNGVLVLCVVGNKCDLDDEREVTIEEAQEFAIGIKAFHFETSAVTNKGIEEVFLHVTKALIFHYEAMQDLNGTLFSESLGVPGGEAPCRSKERTITLERQDNLAQHRRTTSTCCSS